MARAASASASASASAGSHTPPGLLLPAGAGVHQLRTAAALHLVPVHAARATPTRGQGPETEPGTDPYTGH